MKNKKRIFVAGHLGMVGSAIVRVLQACPAVELVLRSRKQLDLSCQQSVSSFFENEKIDEVYLAAAKVGGIHANNAFPAEFIYQNLIVETNVVHNAWKAGVNKLVFLGSSCIYPRQALQPIDEESLLTGLLEPTNEPYAIAKIAGIKLCESYNRQYGADYRSVMPTNLYGPGDNYHSENSHVVPALIRRFHEAKLNSRPTISIWGTGTPRREFLYVDDMAAACVHIMNIDKTEYDRNVTPSCSHINVGSGYDITIKELADLLAKVVGFRGEIDFDTDKPDGTPRKLLNSSKINSMGWSAKVELEDGLRRAYLDFQMNGIKER